MSKDYDQLCETGEALIYAAMMRIMARCGGVEYSASSRTGASSSAVEGEPLVRRPEVGA